MSPLEESTTFEKYLRCFWLSAYFYHSFISLQACNRSHSYVCTFLLLTGKEVLLKNDKDPYCLTKESPSSPTCNMMTSLMEKDLALWMSHDLHMFDICKFCAYYMSDLE